MGYMNDVNKKINKDNKVNKEQGIGNKKFVFKVLDVLRFNSRIRIVDIARRFGLKPSKALEVINYAERFVRKYSFILNHERLGFKHHVIVIAKNSNGLLEFLNNHPAVNFIGITIQNLVIVQAFFKNFQELETFKEAIGLITGSDNKVIHITIDVVRENARLSED